jgi:hypothetical protein
MKYLPLSLFLLLAFNTGFAQPIPVKFVTVFKNGKSLIHRAGTVKTQDRVYGFSKPPDALFGTYWATAGKDELVSVFSKMDSTWTDLDQPSRASLLKNNLGKPIKVYLLNSGDNPPQILTNVTCEKVYRSGSGSEWYVLKTESGQWITLQDFSVRSFEFMSEPNMSLKQPSFSKRLEFRFKSDKPEQEIGVSYLADNIGWTPIYRLELNGKDKGRLSLRAELANNGEDLGDTELRLAVGIPNFTFSNRLSILMDFHAELATYFKQNSAGNMSNQYQQVNAFDPETYEEKTQWVKVDEADNPNTFTGSHAEDFYYYTIRPGNFPKLSRYQFPLFETDITPVHFYETVLPAATLNGYNSYKDGRGQKDDKQPVFHYIEFKNKEKFPLTTGVVNILSQTDAGLQPISQDILPYTAPNATCKVRIAQTPEIKVSEVEGDVERTEEARKFFNMHFDLVKIEAHVVVVNYKSEPVTLKVLRTIEGNPLRSEQTWKTRQLEATLAVNPSFTVEWNLEMKAGEERKWTYTYEMYVRR